jgi:hypothetical protein
VPGAAQASAQGDEGLDVAPGSVREDGEAQAFPGAAGGRHAPPHQADGITTALG